MKEEKPTPQDLGEQQEERRLDQSIKDYAYDIDALADEPND